MKKKKRKKEENFLYEYNFFIVPNIEYHLFTKIKTQVNYCDAKKGSTKTMGIQGNKSVPKGGCMQKRE